VGVFCGLIATDLLRQMTSDWLSGFRFLNVFMSVLLFVAISLTSPWTYWDLQNRYWCFLSHRKLTGAMSWTTNCNYDQTWEYMKFTLLLYSFQIMLRGHLALWSFS